jgi:hypothetical protein
VQLHQTHHFQVRFVELPQPIEVVYLAQQQQRPSATESLLQPRLFELVVAAADIMQIEELALVVGE